MRHLNLLGPVASGLAGIAIGALVVHSCAGSAPSRAPDAVRLPPQVPAAPAAPTDEMVLRRFHQLWYNSLETWQKNYWLGIQASQNPMDAWIIQEIMFETKPDFMIECGTFLGGGTALWATMLEQVNPAARVITIDIVDKAPEARKLPILKSKAEFLIGSSTSSEILAKVKARVQGKKVLVLLDSDHHAAHVLEELKAYSPLVQVGGYIIVQDGNINGHPVAPEFGPGPYEALHEFLKGNQDFLIDKARERLMFSLSPDGFLKRVK